MGRTACEQATTWLRDGTGEERRTQAEYCLRLHSLFLPSRHLRRYSVLYLCACHASISLRQHLIPYERRYGGDAISRPLFHSASPGVAAGWRSLADAFCRRAAWAGCQRLRGTANACSLPEARRTPLVTTTACKPVPALPTCLPATAAVPAAPCLTTSLPRHLCLVSASSLRLRLPATLGGWFSAAAAPVRGRTLRRPCATCGCYAFSAYQRAPACALHLNNCSPRRRGGMPTTHPAPYFCLPMDGLGWKGQRAEHYTLRRRRMRAFFPYIALRLQVCCAPLRAFKAARMTTFISLGGCGRLLLPGIPRLSRRVSRAATRQSMQEKTPRANNAIPRHAAPARDAAHCAR